MSSIVVADAGPLHYLVLIERLAELELIELPETFARLRQTSFFASSGLLDAALERDRKRRDK